MQKWNFEKAQFLEFLNKCKKLQTAVHAGNDFIANVVDENSKNGEDKREADNSGKNHQKEHKNLHWL